MRMWTPCRQLFKARLPECRKKVATAGDVGQGKNFIYVFIFCFKICAAIMIYLYSKADSTTPKEIFSCENFQRQVP